MTTNGVSIPPERVRAAEAVAAVLAPGRRVALTTHVNADGDGVGSEVALWHLLNARGVSASFANPTPRALRVAGALLEHGVDPESIYASVYASAPEGRVRLMTEVLETLVVEPEHGLAWVTVPPDALRRHGATADDLDGIVEYPRSIAGVRLALLFRNLANGNVKVSFRSVGDVDVAELAGRFGGGGYRKAAGASLEGTLADVQGRVLAAAREYLGR